MNRTRHEKQNIKAISKRSILLLRFVLPITTFLMVLTEICSANMNPLPDTGQTICYDTNGAEISCLETGRPLFGQDAHYQRTTPTFQENDNETITDQQTALIWVQSSEGIQHTWQDAISYCQELVFAEQTDWRLPGKFELESIVDYGKSYPAINQFFECERSFYWSNTPHANNPEYAWSVYCYDGADHWVHKTNKYFVRCVRTGQ